MDADDTVGPAPRKVELVPTAHDPDARLMTDPAQLLEHTLP